MKSDDCHAKNAGMEHAYWWLQNGHRNLLHKSEKAFRLRARFRLWKFKSLFYVMPPPIITGS